jgi:hypothetical protein
MEPPVHPLADWRCGRPTGRGAKGHADWPMRQLAHGPVGEFNGQWAREPMRALAITMAIWPVGHLRSLLPEDAW